MNDDHKAIKCYLSSISDARKHKFVHEEGLAEEKLATFFDSRGMHGDAMGHFLNAKKCYGLWGAKALVQRVENSMTVLSDYVGAFVECHITD